MRHTASAAALFLALTRCSSPLLTDVHPIPPPNDKPIAQCDATATPTNLTSEAREDGVMLRWESDADAEYSFVLDVRPTGTSTWSELARPAGVDREFLDTAAARDFVYRYRLRAVQSACNTAFSNEAEQATLPLAPSLDCANYSATALRLTFTSPNQRATDLWLERREEGGTFGQNAQLAHASTGTHDDTVLEPGRHYEYRLLAVGPAGETASSTVDCWAPPRAPGDLSVVTSTVSSLLLGWTDTNDNEASYRVRQAGSTLGDVTTPSFLDSGRPAGTVFGYEVYALGAWPEAVAQQFSAALVDGRTRLPPVLTPLNATLDAACVLSLEGEVELDPGASPSPTFASAAASVTGAAWCTQSLTGDASGVTCATAAVAGSAELIWTVTDSAGSVAALAWPVTTALATRAPAMAEPVPWTLAPMSGQQPLDGAQVPACGLGCDAFRGSIAGTSESTCVLTAAGNVSCWGRNNQGQLGDGNKGVDRAAPEYVCTSGVDPTCVPLDSVTALAGGGSHMCALRSSGEVQCWGNDAWSQLGDGTTSGLDGPRPREVCASGSGGGCVPLTGVRSVAAGAAHTCVVLTSGAVRCWGTSEDGRLGNGVNAVGLVANPTPVCATGSAGTCVPLTGVRTIEAGSTHTCALLDAGAVSCWGNNASGQLGDGTSLNASANPVAVCASGTGGTCVPLVGAVALTGANDHTCALMADGHVRCWGANTDGQLGDGTANSVEPNPVEVCASGSLASCVPLANAVALAGGRAHTCALLAGGSLACWGDNSNGQLGDGTLTDRLNPVATCTPDSTVGCVPFTAARSVWAAGYMSCALNASGGLVCAGSNLYGQIGNGRSGSGQRETRLASVCSSGTGAGCSGGAVFSEARLATCTSLELTP